MNNDIMSAPVDNKLMKSDFLTDFRKGFLVELRISGAIFLFIELTR